MKKNPAFILSDKNLSFSKKMIFVFGEKWCWGLMMMLLLLCVFANLLALILFQKQEIIQIIDKSEWGGLPARGNLTILPIPVSNIIVAHTNDGSSCTSRVRKL